MNDPNLADKTARECRKILDGNRECPPADTLVSFREDGLAPGDTAAVATHLGGCPACDRLMEALDEAEGPMTEDASYRAAREEDRHQVAQALGFRVGRPPARPLLERLSWIWETRVPAMVPAAVCAMLVAILFLPERPESPVTALRSEVTVISTDLQTRNAEGPPEYNAPVDSVLKISHVFMKSDIEMGTMAIIEITSRNQTEHLEPQSVVMITEEDFSRPGIEFDLTINTPGSYSLRLSNPGNAFTPVTLKIEILPH